MQMIYSRLNTQPDWSHYYNLIGHTATTVVHRQTVSITCTF